MRKDKTIGNNLRLWDELSVFWLVARKGNFLARVYREKKSREKKNFKTLKEAE